MAALIIEDVTLSKCDKKFSLSIRFRGGRTQILKVPAPIRQGHVEVPISSFFPVAKDSRITCEIGTYVNPDVTLTHQGM